MAATTIEIGVNGQTRVVTIERVASRAGCFRVSWDGVTRVVDARQIDQESLSLVLLESGSSSHLVRCVETDRPGGLDVHVDGAVVPLGVDVGRARFTGRGDGSGSATPGGQHVVAPMPGKVVRLLVHLGDEIEARQGVIVIEAMKMENELTAPRAGRVSEIVVEEGASVQAGKVLVVIE